MIHRPDTSSINNEPVSHDHQISKQVIFRNGEIPNVTQMAISTFPPGERTTSHTHPDMSEVYHVLSGEANFFIDETCTLVKEGEFVAVLPNEEHSVEASGDFELKLLYYGVLSTS